MQDTTQMYPLQTMYSYLFLEQTLRKQKEKEEDIVLVHQLTTRCQIQQLLSQSPHSPERHLVTETRTYLERKQVDRHETFAKLY